MSHRGTPTPIPVTLGANYERETMSENAPPLDDAPQGKGKPKIGKFGWITIIIAVPVVLYAIVSGDDGESSSASSSSSSSSNTVKPNSSGSMDLSEAFCSDLESGLTPMNTLGGMVKDGTYTPQKAADLAYGYAAISCPEQLKTNEFLRVYLENWNINPDV